jgi:hypothetical protein
MSDNVYPFWRKGDGPWKSTRTDKMVIESTPSGEPSFFRKAFMEANREKSREWRQLCDSFVSIDRAKGHDKTIIYRMELVDGEVIYTQIPPEDFFKLEEDDGE